ncbi:hypothetical protein P0136_04735 [Lentisphaerota bacterium ZTH]|nr:hypothetical protein JYG24_04145 [Lentisphaerota bacterium]WET07296.1 hypothetical protein P0136_04735 [Lentisphaerota bacterium ZTH]
MNHTHSKMTKNLIRRYCFILSVVVAWAVFFIEGLNNSSGGKQEIDYFEPVYLMVVIFLLSYAVSLLFIPGRRNRLRRQPLRRTCRPGVIN